MFRSVLLAMSWEGGVWEADVGMGVGAAGACLGCWTGPSCLVTWWQPLTLYHYQACTSLQAFVVAITGR